MELKHCNRCDAEPLLMGLEHGSWFKDSLGYSLVCPVCKRSSGYFASEERAIETWNEMNPDAP